MIHIPNIKSPPGPILKLRVEGSISLQVSREDEMISMRTVLRPMLKKSVIKMMMTATEMNPPVAVLYYAYPLYLTREGWRKRSGFLRILLRW